MVKTLGGLWRQSASIGTAGGYWVLTSGRRRAAGLQVFCWIRACAVAVVFLAFGRRGSPAPSFRGLLTLTLLLALCAPSSAQTAAQQKAQLEKERASIQKEIDEVRRSLDDTRKNKRENLQQLDLLQRRLQLRESAIRNMNQQIDMIQNNLNGSQRDIGTLTSQLDTLRAHYAESLVFAYKNRSSYDALNFIFSAASIDDAIRRWQYLKAYRAYREGQAEDIVRTQNLLQNKIDGLKVTRVEKEDALKQQSKEKALLEDEKKEKNQVVDRLANQEKDLAHRMAIKQQQDKKLNLAIQAAMRRAMEEAAARRRALAKAAAEKAAAEKAAAERRARERAAAAKAAAERLAREKAEAERLAHERAVAEKAAADRRAREKAASDKATADRLARERAEADRVAREKAVAEKAASDRLARDRAASEKLARDNAAAEKADAESAANAAATTKAGRKSPPDSDDDDTEDAALTGNFEKFKGRLPWPVAGRIAETYGLHEYMKGITHFNMGWTMEAPGASVKVVFEGVVQHVEDLGGDEMVMVRHGNYFTTYSNLGTVAVSKGQKVHAGQIIGRIADGEQLEFIISEANHGNTYDPAKWMKR